MSKSGQLSTNTTRQSSTFNMYRMLRRNNCKTSNYYEGETYPSIRPPLSVCDPSLITKWLSDPQNLEGCPRLFNMRRDNVLEVWNQSPDKHTLSFYGVGSHSQNPEADLFNKVLMKSLNQANGKKVQSRKKNSNDAFVPKGMLKCGDNPKHNILNRQALKAELLRMPTIRGNLDPHATLNSIDCYKLACTKLQFTSKVPMKKRKRSLSKKYRYCDQSEKCDISENRCTEYEWSQYKENPRLYDEAFKQLQQEQFQEEVQEEPKDYEELYSRLICCFNENPEGNEIVSLYEKCCQPHPPSDDDEGVGAEPVKSSQKLTSNKRPGSKPSKSPENKTSVENQSIDRRKDPVKIPSNKLDDKSSDRKVDRPSSKTDQSIDRRKDPVKIPSNKLDNKSSDRKVDRPSSKTDQSIDRRKEPVKRPPNKLDDKSSDRKAGRPSSKTDQSIDRRKEPVKGPPNKLDDKSSDRKVDRPSSKTDQSIDRRKEPAKRPPNKLNDKSSERKVDRPSSKNDKMLQEPGQKVDDNAANRNVEKPSDRPSDKTGQKTGKESGHKTEEKPSETTEKLNKKHGKKTEQIKDHMSEESVKHEPQKKLEEKKADDKTSEKTREQKAKDQKTGVPKDHIKKPTKYEENGAEKGHHAGAKADKRISGSKNDKESSQEEHKKKRDSMTEFVRRVLPKEADVPMAENQSSPGFGIPTDAFDEELLLEQNPAEKVDSKSSHRKKAKKDLEKLKNEPSPTEEEANLVSSVRPTLRSFETPKMGTPSKYQKDTDSLELKTTSQLTLQKPNRPLQRRLKKPKKKPAPLDPKTEPAAVVQKVCPCVICKFMKRHCREPDTPLIREMKRREKERQIREYMRRACHREYMKRRQVAKLGAPQRKCDPILCDNFVYHNPQLSKYCESLKAMQKLQAVLKRIKTWTGHPLHCHLNDLRSRIVLRICDCMEDGYKKPV